MLPLLKKTLKKSSHYCVWEDFLFYLSPKRASAGSAPCVAELPPHQPSEEVLALSSEEASAPDCSETSLSLTSEEESSDS